MQRGQPKKETPTMSDNLRRYRAICHALTQAYPTPPSGHFARHLQTLAAIMSGIVGGKSTQLPHIATKVPDGSKPESRVKRFARWLDNDRILEEMYFVPYAEILLTHLALETLVLVMDGSVVGRDCTALMIHVIYKGRALPLAWRVRQGPKGHFPEDLHIAVVELMREVIPDKPGHDILAIRGDLRRPDLKEKSLPLRTENPLFFSYIIISGHRSMRLKPGRLNAPPAERVSWPGLDSTSAGDHVAAARVVITRIQPATASVGAVLVRPAFCALRRLRRRAFCAVAGASLTARSRTR